MNDSELSWRYTLFTSTGMCVECTYKTYVHEFNNIEHYTSEGMEMETSLPPPHFPPPIIIHQPKTKK